MYAAFIHTQLPQQRYMPVIDFGTWLKKARDAKGWTGERLADELPTSQGLISMYERGLRTPRRPRIIKIANLLDGSVAEALLSAGYSPNEDGDDEQEEGEIVRIHDSQEREVVKYLRGMPPEIRDRAVIAVKNWKDAGDMVRAERERNTLGKTADRYENPTVREDSERGRKVARAEAKQRQEEETKTAEQELFWKEDPEGALAEWMKQNGEQSTEKEKDHAFDGDPKRNHGN